MEGSGDSRSSVSSSRASSVLSFLKNQSLFPATFTACEHGLPHRTLPNALPVASFEYDAPSS
jgi:hypothetical protein